MMQTKLLMCSQNLYQFQTDQTGQTGKSFKLDFPGHLCRAAFVIFVFIFVAVATGHLDGESPS